MSECVVGCGVGGAGGEVVASMNMFVAGRVVVPSCSLCFVLCTPVLGSLPCFSGVVFDFL